MFCAISYRLYNLKDVKNTHGRVLLLVKLLLAFTKNDTPPWVFFTFLKLYKRYQIAQNITYATRKTWKSTNLTFLLNRGTQENFCTCNLGLSHCHTHENWKDLKASYRKWTIACVGVGTCKRTPFMTWPTFTTRRIISTTFLNSFLLVSNKANSTYFALIAHFISMFSRTPESNRKLEVGAKWVTSIRCLIQIFKHNEV